MVEHESLNSEAVQPDPSGARVVLIGASEYDTMENLPAVGRNLDGLRDLLTAPDIWGLPAKHCTVVRNPSSGVAALEAVHTAAAAATSALVVYFAGHGLLNSSGDLYLVPGDADHRRLFRAIRYDEVRQQLLDTVDCQAKVVILDCCYSGRALDGRQGGPGSLASEAVIEGTFVMTASARDKPAWAPPGERYTAFSGALIECIESGLDLQPDLLNMDTLFLHARQRLKGRNLSMPEQRSREAGRFIALARNRRGPSTVGPPVPSLPAQPLPSQPLPSQPLPSRPLVRAGAPAPTLELPRPARVAERAADLRAAGHGTDADALLVEAGARQPDQGVAALVDLLHEAGRPDDVRRVIDGAAVRQPAGILGAVAALRAIDLPDDAHAVLVAAGRRPPDEAAPTAALLRARGATADLGTVIDAALFTARRHQSIVTLVGALWLAGFRSEVDALLLGAAHDLAPEEAADLADELRAAGRQEAAFQLYAVAAPVVAARPATAVAELVRAMYGAGDDALGSALATATIAAVGDAGRAVELFRALDATGLAEQIPVLVTHCASTLPAAAVAVTADQLFEHHVDAPAVALLHATAGTVDQTLAHVALLRKVGRPVDARDLLAAAARRLPAAATAQLLTGLATRDAEFVMSVLASAAAPEMADLIVALVRADAPAFAESCLATYLAEAPSRATVVPALLRSPPAVIEVVVYALLRRELPGAAATAIAGLPPPLGRQLLHRVIARGGADAVLTSLRDRAGPDAPADPVLLILLGCPPTDPSGVRDVDFGVVIAAHDRLDSAGLRQETAALVALVVARQQPLAVGVLLHACLELAGERIGRQLVAAVLDGNARHLAVMVAGLEEPRWRTVVTWLAELPVERVIRLAEWLEGRPVRVVDVLRAQAEAGRIPADAATGAPAVLAAFVALGVPKPRLHAAPGDGRRSFAGFVRVIRALPPPAAREAAARALRRLDAGTVGQMLAAFQASDPVLFRWLADMIISDPAGPGMEHLPRLLAADGPASVVAATRRLNRAGQAAAATALLDELAHLLGFQHQFRIARELHRAGEQAGAMRVMRTGIWPDIDDLSLAQLLVARTVHGIGALSANCALFPSADAAWQAEVQQLVGDVTVIYAVGGGGADEPPVVVLTYDEVIYLGGGSPPMRVAYLLGTVAWTRAQNGRVKVGRPGRRARYWELAGTGVTPERFVDLIRQVRLAYECGAEGEPPSSGT